MTKEEWTSVAAALSRPYGRVKLLVDGYTLDLVVACVKPLRFEITFYVDGFFKGEWITTDCEIRRRFTKPMQIARYKPSEKARLVKGFGKRAVKKYFPDLDKKLPWFSPVWPTFGPLKRHLLANNKSIELVKDPECN